MKKNFMAKSIAFIGTSVIMVGALAGCGKTASDDFIKEPYEVVIMDEDVAKADSIPTTPIQEELEDVFVNYDNPNGWSVTYNDTYIDMAEQDDMVAFVYMGESAGTNMITVTYTPGKNAKDAVDETVEAWGNENATKIESIFPGTEDVTGYWAMLPLSEEGSGYYDDVIARDYKDGRLVFEITGHNCGDDMIDMAVSDTLSMIIDSITFSE